MSGQMKLDSYFKPFSKRKFSDSENNDTSNTVETTNENKKSKFTSIVETSLISDEIKNRIVSADMKVETVIKVDCEEWEVKTDASNVETTENKTAKNLATKAIVSADEIRSNQQLIAQKHLKAKIIRTSKLFPVLHENICETWFKALESEFQKPYFKKVRAKYILTF